MRVQLQTINNKSPKAKAQPSFGRLIHPDLSKFHESIRPYVRAVIPDLKIRAKFFDITIVPKRHLVSVNDGSKGPKFADGIKIRVAPLGSENIFRKISSRLGMPIAFDREVFVPHLKNKYNTISATSEAKSSLYEYFGKKNAPLPKNSFEYFGYKLSQKQKELTEWWQNVYWLPF